MAIKQEILEDAYPVIQRLAHNRSINGAFAYYENSDVFQEVWMMCLDALERYDSTIGPIENYLVRHVTNRLNNLRRDKYFRPGSDVSSSGLARVRMNLVNALPLDGGDTANQGVLLGSEPINIDPIDHILYEETLDYIRERLSEELLEPFENLIGKNKVRSPLVEEIQQTVAAILSERDNDAGY